MLKTEYIVTRYDPEPDALVKPFKKGYNVTYTELPDGHMFPITRVRLAIETLKYLREMDT